MGKRELASFPLFAPVFTKEKGGAELLPCAALSREAVVDAVAVAAAEASTVALSRSQEGPSLFLCF
jgi:hypothetical protein